MLLKGAYCVGEHFVDPHSFLIFTAAVLFVVTQNISYICRLRSTSFLHQACMALAI